MVKTDTVGIAYSSYIDDSLSGVLHVNTDGEIKEVVHGVTSSSEVVDGLLPREGLLVPRVTLEDWPPAQPLQHVEQWLHATGLYSG